MRRTVFSLFAYIALALTVFQAYGQERSSSSGITRRSGAESITASSVATGKSASVSDRMQLRLESGDIGDADMAWSRVIYRSLDLGKIANAPLYYPVDPVDGEENLFRIIIRLIADNSIPAYEFLDGREVFSEKYRLSPRDIFSNYQIMFEEGKGSTEKNPKLIVDESDVPANEVLSYYIIEKWEFDRRNNKLRSKIEALCPVLHRMQEYGMEASRYPLCWIKYDDIRPHLMGRSIIISDDNNHPSGTYDDYFRLGRYDGEIYKTRNLRNRTMAELYPDPDDLKHARDSIELSLKNFDSNLWVPSLEELQAKAEAREAAAMVADTAAVSSVQPKSRVSRSASKRTGTKSKPKKAPKASKPKKAPKASSTATRSVRNRRR